VLIDLLCTVVAAATVVTLLVLFFTMRFRTMGDAERLLGGIQKRQQKLLPFVANDDSCGGRDDQIWEAVGGIRGLFQLPRDAFALLSVCSSLGFQESDPDEHGVNTRRVETIILASVGTFFEASLRKVVPWMPRPYLRLAATEYWRICLSLQTLVAEYRPNMIERVAEVL
jgi:hypothetical protein